MDLQIQEPRWLQFPLNEQRSMQMGERQVPEAAGDGDLVLCCRSGLQKFHLMCFLRGLLFASFWQSLGWELGGKPVFPFFQLDAPRPMVYLLCLLYVLVSDFLYKLCICVASTPLKVFA